MTSKKNTQSEEVSEKSETLFEIVAKTADAEHVYLFTDKIEAREFRKRFISCKGKGYDLGTPRNPKGLPLKSVSKIKTIAVCQIL